MNWKRTIILIFTIAGLAVTLFLLITAQLLQEPTPVTVSTSPEPIAEEPRQSEITHSADTTPDTAESLEASPVASISSKRLLEIFGRVSDADGEPLEDTLITEERYFTSARSDALGQYRLLLELPRQRLPVIQFLRAGYRGERIHLGWEQLADRPIYGLDVELADNTDTLRLDGWIGNDNGIPLEGARITIKSVDTSSEKLYYLTVFSDERGQFRLEGVPADSRYHLTATMAPHYPVYSDPDFYFDNDTRPLEIVLNSLKFVTLGGMILGRDGTPIADLELYIKNLSTGLHTRKIVSDSSGFFALENFPLGEVVLTTRGAEFFRIAGMEITEANYSNLALVVDRGDRYLSGWVSDVNDLPLAKVMVTLETRREIDGVEYFSYRSQTTDTSGRFAFTGIARGEHRISAYASGFDKLEMDRFVERLSEPLQLTLTRPY